MLTLTFWTFRHIQNAKASAIFNLSSWNFFCMFHTVWWTQLHIRIFVFDLLFKLKNNFHTTDTRKIKKKARDIYERTLGIEFEWDWSVGLDHGCARVAHCVTARWRNFSHYCCPLRQYDVWFTCSEHREALLGAPTAHGVHKQEVTVQGGSTLFATEQVGRLRYVTAVDGGLEAFPLSIVICAPVV